MENKNSFAGIIIPVIIAVILLTVLPIVNSMNVECPPCEECPSYDIGQLNINPDFSSGNYIVDKGSYDYIDSATIIKDENLIPENIKKDVNIFGIVGTYEGDGLSGGYNVSVIKSGGGSTIDMLVKFSDGNGLRVDFPYGLPGGPSGSSYYNISLKNVVWLKVLDYEYTWASSTGISEAQATATDGYTLTQNVKITIED